MISAINAARGFLSWKACFFYLLISGAILFFTYLVYDSRGFAPVIWSGTCEPYVGRESAHVRCDIMGRNVTDTISLRLFYEVVKEHKTLHCDVTSTDSITCAAGN